MARRLPPTGPDPTAAIDRSLKALARQVPATFFRLAGLDDADPRLIRTDDVSVHLAEFRADQVFLALDDRGTVRYALYFEYQLRPDRSQVPNWLVKYAGLTRQLGVKVILVVVYLTRGLYRRFPSSYTVRVGKLRTGLYFETVRLWEHAERIRSGELAELAPLLLLCEESPTEEVLREERERILRLPVSTAVRAEMLAVAMLVGTRYFGREVLEEVFREEREMLKDVPFIEEWLVEAEERGLQKGHEEGRVEGRVEGERELLLRLLRAKFPELPEAVVSRVQREGPQWCQEMAVRLLTANSLAELGL